MNSTCYTIYRYGFFSLSFSLLWPPFLQMISAERIMGYSNLDSEAPLETLPPHEKPSPAWPERGEIVLDNVSFCYAADLPLVLKSLSFHIKASEKVYRNESKYLNNFISGIGWIQYMIFPRNGWCSKNYWNCLKFRSTITQFTQAHYRIHGLISATRY